MNLLYIAHCLILIGNGELYGILLCKNYVQMHFLYPWLLPGLLQCIIHVAQALLHLFTVVCLLQVKWVSRKQIPLRLLRPPPNDSELNWLGLGNWVNQVPFKSLHWTNWPES